MEVFLSDRFMRAYRRLSETDKVSVRKALALLTDNPNHPSLQLKKLHGKGEVWEARCSLRLRMTFDVEGNLANMRIVGEHDKVLKNP